MVAGTSEENGMMRQLSVIYLAALLTVPSLAQTSPAAPPTKLMDAKPAAKGLSLAETAKFIEEKMNGQGQIGWVFTTSSLQGISTRTYYQISDTQFDAATCTLTTRETTNYLIEPAVGITYSEGGKPVTAENLRRRELALSVTPLKQVVSVKVESADEAIIRGNARAGRPDITTEVTPPIYLMILMTSGKDSKFHRELNRGEEAPKVWDENGDSNRYTFREKELADQVASAFQHAVELCGGNEGTGEEGPAARK
jgi:hypothetical protein